jgi:probable O-glycosylation ligase (exosortase A-associated)
MRDLVLALFIFGTIPFILSRPYIGLLVWSWLGYMNPNRLCYGFAISFPWVQLMAIVTLMSLVLSKESKKIPWSAVSVLLVAFLLWTGISTYYAAVPVSAWKAWLEFVKILVMVFVTLILVDNRQRMDWLVWVIVVSLGFYGLKGGIFTILKGGNYHVLGPSASFIADNNALALALCMTLPLIRYLQLHSSRKWLRAALWVLMILTSVTVIGTYSRGGLIALAVAWGALFLKSRRRFAVVLVAVAIGFAAYHFMPSQWTERMGTLQHAEQTDSGATRIESYKFAVNVALHHPFLGGGFNVYQSPSAWARYAPTDSIPRAIHSIYLRVLGEQGFMGLALFLALLFASWRNCSKARKLTRGVEEMKWAFDLASMLQVTLVAYMTAGAFLPMSYFDLSYQLMALSAALSAHCIWQIRRREPPMAEATSSVVLPRRPVAS